MNKPKDLNDDGEAGYRAGVRPEVSLDDVQITPDAPRDSVWLIPAHIDLSQCNNLHRQKALAAHKHAIATAETDAYAKPVPIKGIDWSVWAFIAAMAMLGLAIAGGVAMVTWP